MKQKQIVMLAITVLLFSIGTGMAYAQNDTSVIGEPETVDDLTIIQVLITFLTFVAAGVFYAASGWIKKIRRKLAGDEAKLDLVKLGKTTLIGVILGVAAMIASIAMGEVIIVEGAQQFLTQIGINSAAILFIDKWILGRAESPVNTTTTTTTGGT